MASAKSNILKAIGGASTGVAGVEAASRIPSETLDEFVDRNPLGYLAAEAAVLGGGAKAAEKISQTKAAEALKQKLLKKAAIKAGTATAGSLISGPFAPAVALGAAGYSIYDIAQVLKERGVTLEDVGQFIKDNTGPKMAKVSEKEAKRRKKAKAKRSEQIKKRGGKEFKFKKTKKEILKGFKRKKGGKVGRPKGVGCAVKGYGKAMTRG